MFANRRSFAARQAMPALLAGLCLSSTLSNSVAAAPAASPDPQPPAHQEEIVVTATRVETPVAQVGSSVTVLQGDDLVDRGFSSVADALRSAPGLEVSRSGGPGQITSVFVRGGSSSQTLVLLDGVRLNSATTGAFDFADLSLDQVERIEIVRGPQSPLYGSEAAAGVIQIFTRKGGPGLHLKGHGEVGESDHHRLRLAASGNAAERGLDGHFTLADASTRAASAADLRRGNNELDRHDHRTLAGSLGWAPSQRQRFDLDLRYFAGDADIDGYAFPAGPVDDFDARLERRAKIGGFSYQAQPTAALALEARFGFADDDLEAIDPTDPFGSYFIESRERELAARATFSRGRHQLTVGASLERRRGGTELAFDAEVDLDGVYLQDFVSLGEKASLTLGIRRDDHSSFDAESTGRAALAIELGQGWRFHGSWGQGFKAPTLNDLYYPFFGNPALQPEKSAAFDAGIERGFAGGRVWADLTYFDADFDDLIAFDFLTFLPQNIARASSRGVESQLRWRQADGAWDGAFGYTWNETEDEETGLALARRPKQRATLDLAWRSTASWRLAGHVVAVADRIDSDGTPLEDYVRLDVSVAYKVGRWEPGLRVLNLTDDDTSEVGGFGTQGRTAILAVELAF